MSLLHNQERLRYYAPVVVCLVLIALLLALPTGFEGALIYQGADRCAARVLSTDDSAILDTGLVRSGEQVCTLELLGGKFRGRTVQGHNLLNGSLEQDKIFAPSDRALVVISYRGTGRAPYSLGLQPNSRRNALCYPFTLPNPKSKATSMTLQSSSRSRRADRDSL